MNISTDFRLEFGRITRFVSQAFLAAVVTVALACSKAETAPAPAPGPFGVELFVRGSMNAWKASNHMDPTENVYATVIKLAPGPYTFKLGDRTWKSVDLGVQNSKVPVALDTEIKLEAGGKNITLKITEPGEYAFILNAEDKAAPILKIQKYQ